jgi:thiol-disulfide isomerase/thioredoxin
MRRWSLPAALLLLFLLAQPSLAKSTPPAATPAPHFALDGRNGTVDLDSLRGKLVLVDFWASWCGPCQKSFPWMASMVEKYGSKGFVVVAVNLDKDRQMANDFLAKQKTPFLVAYDPSGRTAKAYKVWGMPTSYLVSPKGEIVYTHMGFNDKNQSAFEEAIAQGCPQ